MNVLFLPHYRRNPYQRELAAALRAREVDVRFSDPLPPLAAFAAHGTPDVLHVHWTQQLLLGKGGTLRSLRAGGRFLAQLREARRQGVRVVWTVHNLLSHERRHPTLERWFTRVFAGMCDRVIVHCHFAEREVRRLYDVPRRGRGGIHVVAHGNYLARYPGSATRDEVRGRLGIEPDALVLLFFGRIRAYKGLGDLIDVFGKLDTPRARLLLVGEVGSPELAADLERRCAADPRIVHRFGFAPAGEVQGYMAAADAVVLPFEAVLTSGSVLLGMSFGKAVIAPAMGCIPEVLDGDGALLYRAGEEEDLLSALERASSADLEAMGRRNRERAAELDWGPIAEQTLEVYRLALADGGAA
jgi:beta-1,4-mannosyltransferase